MTTFYYTVIVPYLETVTIMVSCVTLPWYMVLRLLLDVSDWFVVRNS